MFALILLIRFKANWYSENMLIKIGCPYVETIKKLFNQIFTQLLFMYH